MLDGLFVATAWAQSEAPTQADAPLLLKIFPYIGLIIIFYIFVMRPNQKRQDTTKQFQEKLKRGDSVLTSGGILGTIEGLTDQFATLQIADGVKVRILRNQIASPVSDELVKK